MTADGAATVRWRSPQQSCVGLIDRLDSDLADRCSLEMRLKPRCVELATGRDDSILVAIIASVQCAHKWPIAEVD